VWIVDTVDGQLIPDTVRAFLVRPKRQDLVGLGITVVGINPIKALVYAAVINGVVAVPLILLILLMSSNRAIMGRYVNRRWVNVIGWCSFVAMGVAALTTILTWRP